MDIQIKVKSEDIKIESATFKKMVFLYNALNNGWSIKKRKGAYIFAKNHEGKKEVYDDDYLSMFMKENMDVNQILK